MPLSVDKSIFPLSQSCLLQGHYCQQVHGYGLQFRLLPPEFILFIWGPLSEVSPDVMVSAGPTSACSGVVFSGNSSSLRHFWAWVSTSNPALYSSPVSGDFHPCWIVMLSAPEKLSGTARRSSAITRSCTDIGESLTHLSKWSEILQIHFLYDSLAFFQSPSVSSSTVMALTVVQVHVCLPTEWPTSYPYTRC